MLGRVRGRQSGLRGKLLDGALALGEEFEEFEAASAGERFSGQRELLEEGVLEGALGVEFHASIQSDN